MPEDLMRYDLLAQNALRGVVREALRRVEKQGLPGDHHFYIAFLTNAEGVSISEALTTRYPREMTIVLQHKFDGLKVHEDRFEVVLSFDNVPEKLVVPFSAVKGFLDPAVQFGLQFEVVPAQAVTAPEIKPAHKPAPAKMAAPEADADTKSPDPDGNGDGPKVVSLDSFRKK